jgi:DNA repair exonuclease SbcCD ATPase subunit
MKKVFFFSLVIFSLTACDNKQKEIDRLQEMNDSLEVVTSMQDHIVIDYVEAFNEIQYNLDEIKKAENIINLNADEFNNELSPGDEERIVEDIKLIRDLMDENKRKIEQLEQKLRSSGKNNNELQKMITYLQDQMLAKDLEIARLSDKLKALNIEVEQLSATVDTLMDENKEKARIIEEQEVELHTAFYVYGTEKELREQNILTKTGGFIGIGKSTKLKQDFDIDYFTKIDIRDLDEIILQVSEAKLITMHPSASYELKGDKDIEKLEILDSEAFWAKSKFCVIVVK